MVKPHNASESFYSEIAHVTSGHISLAKESHVTNSDINREYNSAPTRNILYKKIFYTTLQFITDHLSNKYMKLKVWKLKKFKKESYRE